MSRWIVYVVRCAGGSLYTGITTDLPKRLTKHNAGRGAKYTRSRRPVVLVWHQATRSESSARRKEAGIKKMTKADKEEALAAGRLAAR